MSRLHSCVDDMVSPLGMVMRTGREVGLTLVTGAPCITKCPVVPESLMARPGGKCMPFCAALFDISVGKALVLIVLVLVVLCFVAPVLWSLVWGLSLALLRMTTVQSSSSSLCTPFGIPHTGVGCGLRYGARTLVGIVVGLCLGGSIVGNGVGIDFWVQFTFRLLLLKVAPNRHILCGESTSSHCNLGPLDSVTLCRFLVHHAPQFKNWRKLYLVAFG